MGLSVRVHAVAVLVLLSFAVALPGDTQGKPPRLLVIDGSPLVPLRYIGEWLGGKIGYDAAARAITFTLGEREVRLKVNSREASVDGRPILLAAPPTEEGGTTYTPIGFLSTYLDVTVEWDPETEVATLAHPETEELLTLRSGDAPAARPGSGGSAKWLKVEATADLPGNPERGSIVVSDDGAHWAYVEASDAGERVVDDREQSAAIYRRVRPPFFVTTTNKLAYWATTTQRRAVVVVDGQEFPTPFPRPGMLVFSPNGEHWAAVGWPGNPRRPESRSAVMLLDGVEVGRYWDAGIPCFSPDSQHLSFLAIDPETRALSVVTDGEATEVSPDPALDVKYKVGPNLSFQTDLEYASDGTLFTIYHDQRGWCVRSGDHVMAAYNISKFNLEPSVTGSGAAHLGHIVYPSSLAVARDAPVAAWWARPQRNSPWMCCMSGREFKANDEVKPADDRLVISPNGKRVARRYRHFEGKGEQRHQVGESVCVNGEMGAKYEWVESIQFSPSSGRLAYRARRAGAWRDMYVIDGEAAGPDGQEVFLLTFSPDERHHAYASEHDGRSFVVCNGTEWLVPWPEILHLSIDRERTVRVVARQGTQIITASGKAPR